MSGVLVLGALVVASTATSVRYTPRPQTTTSRPVMARPSGFWLLLVTALVYLNQALFTIYVIRVRHGDSAFIASTCRPAGSRWPTTIRSSGGSPDLRGMGHPA